RTVLSINKFFEKRGQVIVTQCFMQTPVSQPLEEISGRTTEIKTFMKPLQSARIRGHENLKRRKPFPKDRIVQQAIKNRTGKFGVNLLTSHEEPTKNCNALLIAGYSLQGTIEPLPQRAPVRRSLGKPFTEDEQPVAMRGDD